MKTGTSKLQLKTGEVLVEIPGAVPTYETTWRDCNFGGDLGKVTVEQQLKLMRTTYPRLKYRLIIVVDEE
jgi:hypothetical protein